MQQQIKTGLGVALIIILTATVAVITWKIIKFKQGIQMRQVVQTQAPSQVTTEKQAAQAPKAEEIVYTNSDYGFQLTLPISWKNYQVIPEKTPDSMEVSQIHFLYSPNNELFFTIVVVDSSARDKFCTKTNNKDSLSCLVSAGDNIWGKTNKYIFYPFVSNDPTLELSKFINGDLKLIQKSFKIIDNQTSDWQTYRNGEYGFEFKYPNEKFKLEADEEKCYSQEKYSHLSVTISPINDDTPQENYGLILASKCPDSYNEQNKSIKSMNDSFKVYGKKDVQWICNKDLDLVGKSGMTCYSSNTNKNTIQAGFTFGTEKTLLSEDDFIELIKNLSFF